MSLGSGVFLETEDEEEQVVPRLRRVIIGEYNKGEGRIRSEDRNVDLITRYRSVRGRYGREREKSREGRHYKRKKRE